MVTLAVTGTPDSHRGPVILAGPDGQRSPDCPEVLFVGFRTDFVTSVRVLVASAVALAPGSPPQKNRGRAHTLFAPSLGYVPGPEGGDRRLSSRRS